MPNHLHMLLSLADTNPYCPRAEQRPAPTTISEIICAFKSIRAKQINAIENTPREHGVQDVFLTMWGDDGGECSPFTLLPSLFYASELAKGETDDETIKAHFAQRFGAAFDDFMQLDLPADQRGDPAGAGGADTLAEGPAGADHDLHHARGHHARSALQ